MARPDDKPFSVEDCFNKIKEDDSDKRFVGVQDLVNALTKKTNPVKLDAAGETKLVDKLVDMVALDTSSGVRGLAVRALGLITKTAQETNLKTMIDKLPAHLEKDKHNVKGQEITGEVRESVATCLKVVVESVPDTQTSIIDACKDKLAPRLVALAKKTNEADLLAKVLDVLSELLGKWGAHLNKKENLLADVQKVAFPQLKSNVWACRNRASACLASVSVYANDAQLLDIVEKLSAALADVESLPEHTLSYIQAITAMSRAVGSRFGPHLDKFMGTLVAIIQDPNYDEEHGDIRVAALQSFEAFLVRCPKSIEPHLEQIEELGVGYLTYDPNAVAEEEEEGGDDAMMDEDFDDDDGGDNDAFGADADGGACPWKSAASHLISTVISTRPDRLDHVYDTLVDSLIRAFKEDDDGVRSEIFNTFMAALRQTENVTGGDQSASASTKLKEFTEPFVKAVIKELKGKSLKTRPAAFKMSALFLQVLPGSFSKHIAEFVPGLKAALGTKKTNSALKAEALSFFTALLSHDKKDVASLITDLAPSVYSAFKDSAPQTAIAALHAASSMASVAPANFDVGALYKATVDRLSDSSTSSEVLEAVIDAVASILASSGDKLGDQVGKALTALVAKMGQESAKLAAVKAFGSLAKSKKVDLKAVIGDVLGNVIKFLPQDNRQLKVACLNALLDLIAGFGKEKAAAGHFEKLISELVNLLGDSSLVGYAVKAIAQILNADSKTAAKPVKEVVLPRVQKELLSAATLQGLALEGVLELYQSMAKSDSKDLASDKLLAGLSEIGNDKKTPHSALKSVAQCVGVLATVGDKAGIVKKFLDDKEFSLYCLGEIGRRVDLSDTADVKNKILKAFDSDSTDVRNAAAVAFGSVAAGNLQKYLPDIIAEMKNASRQYLLLTSIREAIVATDSEKISGFSDKLLEILFQHTDAKDEGTRSVVAESLGKLVLTNPKVIDNLAEKTGDKNPATRATVAACLRAALPDKPHPIDAVWSKKIGPFLTLIGDSEVSVRKEALLSLDLAARVKPRLIRSHLPKTLPVLYQQTNIIKELIEEKVIGIFKVIVDHGLGARQAAFGVLNTLLDSCFDALDLTAFIDPLANGLGEEDPDVRMLCGLILVKLMKKASNVLVAGLEKLIPSLKKGALLQPKDAKFNVEIEANLVAVTGYLRCIGYLSRLPDTAASPAWKDLITSISTAKLMEKPLQETYEKVLKTLD